MTITSLPAADEDCRSVMVEHALGIGGQEFHREMDSLEVAAFDGQIARFCRTSAENDCIKFLEQTCPPGNFFRLRYC